MLAIASAVLPSLGISFYKCGVLLDDCEYNIFAAMVVIEGVQDGPIACNK
jgi:hypothetical protein